MAENEINTVHVLIRRFLYEIDDVIKDKDASHKWLVSFAKTLQFQDLCKTPNEYALTLLREAKEFCLSQRKKSQIKQVRKILSEEGNAAPTKEQIESRWAELYGDDDTSDGSYESTTVSKNSHSGEARQSQRTAGDSQREETSAQKAGGSHKAPAPAVRMPPSKTEFMDWVCLVGIDEVFARRCYEMCERNGWKDKNGKDIGDWQKFTYGFVTDQLNKRKKTA